MFMFVPFRVIRQLKAVPVVTITLIVVNTLLCFATFWNGPLLDALGFRMNVHGLYTWFTSMFLHGDPIFHLGGNMYFLWLFGSVVEDGIGRLKYLGLYLLGGLAASLVHGLTVMAFLPQMRDVPVVGASGALAAVVGLFAVRCHKDSMRVFYVLLYRFGTFELTAVAGVALWGMRELLNGMLMLGSGGGTVAHWAHLGGLAFGVAAAFVLHFEKDSDREFLTAEAEHYASMGIQHVAAAKYSELAASDPTNVDAVVAAARASAASGLSPDSAAREYVRALQMLAGTERKYELCDVYMELRATAPTAEVEPRILQSVGSAAESLKRLDVAGKAYWEVVRQHPGTREAERAHFRLAHLYLQSGMSDEAERTWASFRQAYPASQWIAYADSRLQALAG